MHMCTVPPVPQPLPVVVKAHFNIQKCETNTHCTRITLCVKRRTQSGHQTNNRLIQLYIQRSKTKKGNTFLSKFQPLITHQPETRNQKPETRNQKLETRNPIR